MAINPETRFPGKIDPSDAEYPHGKARNVVTKGDGTGTPRVADLVNDYFGFDAALLAEAGITPSGNPDTALTSQRLDALKYIFAAVTAVQRSAEGGSGSDAGLLFAQDQSTVDPVNGTPLPILSPNGLPLDLGQVENTVPGTEVYGSTLSALLSTLTDALINLVGEPGHISVIEAGNTVTLSLPQPVGTTDDVTFNSIEIDKIYVDDATQPTITLGSGAGTGATFDGMAGSDSCCRVNITTGTGCTAAADIFTLTYANPFAEATIPIVMITPANRNAQGQQNSIGKAVAIDLLTTDKDEAHIKSGTIPLSDSTSYIWNILSVGVK